MANGKGKRDPITSDNDGDEMNVNAKPKRSDLLNGKPRTTSLGSGGSNLTKADSQKTSWPVPNSPYGRGE